MGLSELAVGMDSTPVPASHELRLELDAETDISSPPGSGAGDGASQQRLSAAMADWAPGRDDPPSAPLSEQAHDQPGFPATPHAPAAAWQDSIPVGPPAPSEPPVPSDAKPIVTGAWQTPLSALRALLAARMHGRRSAAEAAQVQQVVTPPPHSSSSTAPEAAEGRPRDDAETPDKGVSTAAVIPEQGKLHAHHGVAEPLAPARGSAAEMESVLDVYRHCDAGEDRPQKRRRTAREVVCHFFGLQDSDFAEPAA